MPAEPPPISSDGGGGEQDRASLKQSGPSSLHLKQMNVRPFFLVWSRRKSREELVSVIPNCMTWKYIRIAKFNIPGEGLAPIWTLLEDLRIRSSGCVKTPPNYLICDGICGWLVAVVPPGTWALTMRERTGTASFYAAGAIGCCSSLAVWRPSACSRRRRPSTAAASSSLLNSAPTSNIKPVM